MIFFKIKLKNLDNNIIRSYDIISNLDAKLINLPLGNYQIEIYNKSVPLIKTIMSFKEYKSVVKLQFDV